MEPLDVNFLLSMSAWLKCTLHKRLVICSVPHCFLRPSHWPVVQDATHLLHGLSCARWPKECSTCIPPSLCTTTADQHSIMYWWIWNARFSTTRKSIFLLYGRSSLVYGSTSTPFATISAFLLHIGHFSFFTAGCWDYTCMVSQSPTLISWHSIR